MPTRLEIEQAVLRVLRASDEALAGLPLTFQPAAFTTTTVTHRDLGRGGAAANTNLYDGRLVKIAEDVSVAYSTPVTVSGAHTATTTSLAVSSGTLILNGHVLQIGNEKLLVTGGGGETPLTVVRGHQGTTAVALAGGEAVTNALLGQAAGVDDGGFDGVSVLTVSPGFTSDPPDGTDVFLYPLGWSPDPVVDAIRQALRLTYTPHIWFPSIFEDADFGANALTNWALVGAVTTREFVVTAANVQLGERALHVVTTALDGGATSNAVDVTESEQVLVSVPVRAASGSVKVILRNVTAGTDIRTVTVDESNWTEVRFVEAIPDGCEQVALRFLSGAAVSEFYVSPHVVGQMTGGRSYALPSWWTKWAQFQNAFWVGAGQASEVTDSYIPLSERWRRADDPQFLRSDRDVAPTHLTLAPQGNDPIALELLRPFSELASDVAVTGCDLDYAATYALSILFRERSDPKYRFWGDQAAELARSLRYGGTRRPQTSESRVLV